LFGHIGARLAGDAGADKPPAVDPPPVDSPPVDKGADANATSGNAGAGSGDAGAVAIVDTASSAEPMNPYVLWGHVSFWTGVGALAASGACFGLAKMEADAYADEQDPQLGSKEKSRAFAGAAWAALGIGAALVATGAALWLLEPEGETGSGVAASAAPLPGGVSLSFGGRW
ncbi:MAG: hypothetical protein JXR96_07110, partial [Deltaproteobacteria bacterium]|nr:hypothetical protein [Deltaproteobacteria bacterium]